MGFFPQPQPRSFVRTKPPQSQPQLNVRDVPDCVFPTNNSLGIPLLDPMLQAEFLDVPFALWGTIRQSEAFKGTYHFYRQDEGFEAVWKAPHKLVNTRCINVIESNFSCYLDMPPAIAHYQVYRKRWLSRYWQHYGVRIFVDLNVSERYYDLNLYGVPKGWKSWATRAYSDRLENVEVEFELAAAHAGTSNIAFVVYSGGKHAQSLCYQKGWFWFPDEWDKAKTSYREQFGNESQHVAVKLGGS